MSIELTKAVEKRMIQLETKVDYMSEKMDGFEKMMEKKFSEIDDKLTKFIDRADERYSSKWVETAIKWAVTLVMGTIITAILGLILIKVK